MVLATAVPKVKAATKLKNAAHRTATRGDNTRMETTVAMEFAASWKPLRKSKLSATTTMMIAKVTVGVILAGDEKPVRRATSRLMTLRLSLQMASGCLQDHGFENVRDVFLLIRGGFQNLVDFFPFDHFDGIRGSFKQAGDA